MFSPTAPRYGNEGNTPFIRFASQERKTAVRVSTDVDSGRSTKTPSTSTSQIVTIPSRKMSSAGPVIADNPPEPILTSSTTNTHLLSRLAGTSAVLYRASRVYSLAGIVYADYQIARWKAKAKKYMLGLDPGEESDDHPKIEEIWDAAHGRNAERVYNGIVGLRGMWIKVGQYMSSRPDVAPMAYLKELKNLQDSVPERPWKEVEETLREEWGNEWRDKFEWVDEEPLSTASIAQVHRARLKEDGRDVVIKVQHRGIDILMRNDLENLRTLCEIIAKREPEYDFRKIVYEWIPAVREELDLRLEAQNLLEAKSNLQKAGVNVIVPEPVEGYTTRMVLVMEYCDGFSVRDFGKLDKHGVDREKLLERVCRAFAIQMHVDGFYNADPHPGNILVSTSTAQNGGDASVPVLLDFGLTKRFSPDMKLAFSRMMHSTYILDVDGLLTSFEEMGLKMRFDDPFQDLTNMRTVFKTVPASKAKQVQKERKLERQEKEKRNERPKRPVDAWPGELVFFFRVTGLLKGLCSSLEVDYPYLKTMAEAATVTVRNSIPAEHHAQSVVYPTPNAVAQSSLQKRMEGIVSSLHDQGEVLGLQVSVFKGGKQAVDVSAGRLGFADPRPVTPSTLFNVFSATKAVAAGAVLTLVDQGKVDLDAPVAQYWPEFGVQGKEQCTVRQALNHQAGLANALPEDAVLEDLLSWEKMVDFVGGAAPAHTPGSKAEYHYLTYGWLLGGIVKGATGMDIAEYVNENVVTPLELDEEMYLGGIPKDCPHDRLAVLRLGLTAGSQGIVGGSDDTKSETANANNGSGSSLVEQGKVEGRKGAQWERFKGREQMLNPTTFNMKRVRQACIPSANGHMSANALARFYSSLAVNNGSATSLLSQQCIDACLDNTKNESVEKSDAFKTFQAQPEAQYGLGFQVYEFRKPNGEIVKGLGHWGIGGSFGFVVPELGIAAAITVSQLSFTRTVSKSVIKAVCEEYGLEPPLAMAL